MGGVKVINHTTVEIIIDREVIQEFVAGFLAKNSCATIDDVMNAAKARFNIWWGKQTGKTAFIESVAKKYYQEHISITSYPPRFSRWWRSKCDDHTREKV